MDGDVQISLISIHAPHTGRDLPVLVYTVRHSTISIHAPHTGRDGKQAIEQYAEYISIHAPHTGRDIFNPCHKIAPFLFQSTRPIRGATCHKSQPGLLCHRFQSTRPIRGATFYLSPLFSHSFYFNPRAPYGARPSPSAINPPIPAFQSTRPIRGATGLWVSVPYLPALFQSTRPIRGATTENDYAYYHFPDFNPRAPYGARPSFPLF